MKASKKSDWGLDKSNLAQSLATFDKNQIFKSMSNDYKMMEHDVLVNNQEEAAKLSKILHGH